jgi:hypothetical protein
MKILAIDMAASKSGWAIYIDGKPIRYGTCFIDKEQSEFGLYPFCFPQYARYAATKLAELVDFEKPSEVILEETNPGKNVYSQKSLEHVHFAFIEEMDKRKISLTYIRTGVWRKLVGAYQNSEEKKLNSKIGRMKIKNGSSKPVKIDGKVVGKKTRKHVALRRVQELFGFELRMKEQDAAEAILIGLAANMGAPRCNGKTDGGLLPKESVCS